MTHDSIAIILASTLTLLIAGCQLPDHAGVPEPVIDGRLKSRLTIAEVTQCVQAAANARGYQISSRRIWDYSLGLREGRRVWTVYPRDPNGTASSWCIVDDDSGAVDFVMPMLQPSTTASISDDRLARIARALGENSYPMSLEDFLKQAQLHGVEAAGGGRETDQLWFLDYTLRQEKDSPERFEVRCFYLQPQGDFGQKLVVRAELAYWDAKVNRYRLVPDRSR